MSKGTTQTEWLELIGYDVEALNDRMRRAAESGYLVQIAVHRHGAGCAEYNTISIVPAVTQ